MLNPIFVEARDLPDLWFQAIYNILDRGRRYVIDRGSYEGQTRLEYDYFAGRVKFPGSRPLIPEIPPTIDIPAPVEEAYIFGGEGYERSYIEYLMTGEKAEGESYTYGSRMVEAPLMGEKYDWFKEINKDIVNKFDIDGKCLYEKNGKIYLNQIEFIIDTYKRYGFNNNQMILQVGEPTDLLLVDPPCVVAGTNIVTMGGIVEAENVKEGDYVLTHAGNFKKVTKCFKRWYDGKIVIVEDTIKNKLLVTPEHPLWTISVRKCDGMVCKPVCKKQYSVYEKHGKKCKQYYKDYTYEWVDAINISKYNNFLVFPSLCNLFDHSIDSVFSKDELFVYGLFLAEGDYIKKDGIRFNLGAHEQDLIYKVIDFMDKCFNLKPHIDKHSCGSCRVSFYSRDLTSKFFNMFGSLSYSKKIPMDFLFLSNNKVEALLDGIVAGDGHIRKKDDRKVEFYTSSKKVRDMFILFLRKLNIIFSISVIRKENMSGGSINGRDIISKHDGYLFSFTLNRKKEIGTWLYDDKYFSKISNSDVSSTNFSGYVYNFEVEDDNSYVANNIVVHNCLRQIGCKILDDKLNFFISFRSWDLYSGTPANLAGIQILKEYMASEIGVEDGEMIVESKGLHLYGYSEDLAKLRCMKEC